MIDRVELYILILMQAILTFIQGHRDMKRQNLASQLSHKLLRELSHQGTSSSLVPAIPADKFTKQQKPGRLIRSSTDKNFISSNTINSYIRNNDRCFVVHPCRTDQLRNSFFCRTVVEWNHLDNNIVHSASVNSFRTAISQ